MILNDTLNSTIIQVNSQPSIWVYIIPGIISILSLIFLVNLPTLLLALNFQRMRKQLSRISRTYGKNIIVMSHRNAGIFGSMITMEDVMKIEGMIRKFSRKNRETMLILNTFGGDMLASMRLAQLIRKNRIDVFVPKYAWSGGSLVSVAAPRLYMSAGATLSPFDVQLGTLWRAFAAKHWIKIAETKKSKMNDDTVAMAELSRELLEEQRHFAEEIVREKKIKKEMYLDYFLFGKKSHAFQITKEDMQRMGFIVLNPFEEKELHELIEKSRKEVFGYEYRTK